MVTATGFVLRSLFLIALFGGGVILGGLAESAGYAAPAVTANGVMVGEIREPLAPAAYDIQLYHVFINVPGAGRNCLITRTRYDITQSCW